MTKVSYLNKQNTDKEIYDSLHPLVAEWFKTKFKGFTEAQKYSLVHIKNRKNILISSPTGSGKTLSAFASVLSYLISLAEKNELEEKVYAIYISPLKALSSDINVNLLTPLAQIREIADRKSVV